MDRETARQYIRQHVDCRKYLEKSKSGLYCCPFCGSGHGAHKTGALKYYSETNTCCCFGKCDRKTYDVFDLYMKKYGVDYATAFTMLAQEAGITLDHHVPTHTSKSTREEKVIMSHTVEVESKSNNSNLLTPILTEKGSDPDYTEYYQECRKRLNDPDAVAYLQSRGISEQTALQYGIGYDPQADPAGNPGGRQVSYHSCPRIIIPTTTSHYIGRSVKSNTPKEYLKLNNRGGRPGIFNEAALYNPDIHEVFVTEGAFDALSLLEIGKPAIALNSTSNADVLIKLLEKRPTEETLILCCDQDSAGRKANEILRQGLQRLNISHISGNICGSYKDPNEYLVADRENFIDAVDDTIRKASSKPDNVSDYITQLMGSDIESFKDEIKTGFSNLDKICGGLYTGLYTVAAISSLGKTTFCSQLADQIAEDGHDVLFFSLEQSRLEMVSKNLARMTAIMDEERAVTSLDIRKGHGGQMARDAAKEYINKVGNRISIIEGNFNCNISFIGDYIRQYIRRTHIRPVVFIDYLQILQPEQSEKRIQSTKDIVDHVVTELKRLSREMGLTIFIISSVNRANYLTPIDFESLKESGGIEYTSDVIWGLQLKCLDDPLFSESNKIKEKRDRVKQAKAETPRKIELCCLKNRYGISNFSCFFDYYPANDLFLPDRDSDRLEKREREKKNAKIINV